MSDKETDPFVSAIVQGPLRISDHTREEINTFIQICAQASRGGGGTVQLALCSECWMDLCMVLQAGLAQVEAGKVHIRGL